MHFTPITALDLDAIKQLQPADWSDIIPDLTHYIRSDFCYPVKITVDRVIAGIGVAIVYDHTAWLAHIIVDAGFRNRGIGSLIVAELLDTIKNNGVTTCLLTATEMGRPVYVKAGFRNISEYVFMTREKPWRELPFSKQIIPFQEQFRIPLLQMDRLVSGENRERLLADFLGNAMLYAERETLQGFYIPGIKEGPVIAKTPVAGLELLKLKCATSEKIVLPEENTAGIEFLKENGFMRSAIKGTRMLLGNHLTWFPESIYSRIGGNFG